MIYLKTPREIAIMREAGRLVAQCHLIIQAHMRPGLTTLEVDAAVEAFIREKGCVPSFKGYRGFPGSTCISVNDEMVHGIPGKRKLQVGDIVKVDVGVIYQGYHGDSVWTYAVGEIDAERMRLIQTTEQALQAGIAQMYPDRFMGDVGFAMQSVAAAAGYIVQPQYGGHGVGRNLHEDPSVPNFGEPGKGVRLRAGMVLAVEPIVIAGKDPTAKELADKWTVISPTHLLSAQCEHTVAITKDGPEILTRL